jgi:predicted SprT family Zn-dependent metalloprotease
MQLIDAECMAIELLAFHKLHEWEFVFDRSKRRFGACNISRKKILLSRELTLLNSAEVVRDTLLHEIAHALAPADAHHGPVWRKIALEIGCNGQRCYGAETITPPKKWVGVCPSCSREVRKHRRVEIACGRCCKAYNGGRFSREFVFVYSLA